MNPLVSATAAAALLLLPGMAGAQGTPLRVAGTVVAGDGERVVGADVRPTGSATGATTTDDGSFQFIVASGVIRRLVVRRIGFRPETVAVEPSAEPLVVHLTRTLQMIRPVLVTAEMNEFSPISQVRKRARESGNGRFLFRNDFMKMNPAQFTDIMRRIPGVQIVRTAMNPETVWLRQNRCIPLYFLDGIAILGLPLDPNTVPVSTIEAIEVYASAALVPPEFRGPMSAQGCGSILIWTRQGERRPRRNTIPTDSIRHLLDAHRVFEPGEVEHPARLTTIGTPTYPDSLLSAGAGGTVVLEFIVTADGRADPASIGVVSATHAELVDPVKAVVADAVFVPAERDGRPVAQVYHLPFTFTPPPRP